MGVRLLQVSRVAVFFFSERCVVLFEIHPGVTFPVVIFILNGLFSGSCLKRQRN